MRTARQCSLFEPLIALYIESDLREGERVRVETHLDTCADCTELANDLRASQAVFKTLRSGTVNSTALVDVRQRVLDEVGDLEPAPAWVIATHRLFFAGLRRRTAIAGIILAALVSGGVWLEETRRVVNHPAGPPIEIAKVEEPSGSVAESVPVPPQRSVVHPLSLKHAIRPVVEPRDTAAPVFVEESDPASAQVAQIPMKFLTDDPDIIIYWLPSDKGD